MYFFGQNIFVKMFNAINKIILFKIKHYKKREMSGLIIILLVLYLNRMFLFGKNHNFHLKLNGRFFETRWLPQHIVT